MNAHKLIAIALAALLVFAGGAAAMPGNAPDGAGTDTADEHAPDDPGADAADHADENASETDGNVTDADDARDENATDAPPTELPEPVPDHVSQIHELIGEKLAGTLGNQTLGEAVSGLVGGGDDAQANSQADSADDASNDAADRSDDARSNQQAGGPTVDLPEQAADRVSQIHDAILSFLDGGGDGNPGDAVSSAAGCVTASPP